MSIILVIAMLLIIAFIGALVELGGIILVISGYYLQGISMIIMSIVIYLSIPIYIIFIY